MTDGSPAIAVAGDVTVDWTIVTPPGMGSNLQLAYLWEREGTVTVSAMPGGAALIAALARGLGSLQVVEPTLPEGALSDPRHPGVTRAFTNWKSFPLRLGSTHGRWRLSEFLGWVGATEPVTRERPANAPVVVLDDANLGFRNRAESWPAGLDDPTHVGHVVLKMAAPIGVGPLWDHVIGAAADRLTVYITLNDLRKEDAAVGQALSWERTASETVEAVLRRPDLSRAKCVVVGIGLSGAVIVEPGAGASLVYDPMNLEGDWEATYPGVPYGVGSAISAALAAHFARSAREDICLAASTGLQLARQIHESGLRVSEGGEAALPGPASSDSSPFASGNVTGGASWSFLREHGKGEYRAIAERVLLEGVEPAASGVPVERMGAWASVDRAEIESVRSVRNIVREYLSQSVRPRPLSIAVFGPPGSGKSFAIKQMAGQWAASGIRIQTLEFNVSQFSTDGALAAAFQRVRDCAVEGAFPLVFWDEFDSARNGQELGWLAQFLAPMQDGTFLEGSLTRPIGSALFVFAGGTHSTMESFKSRASSLPQAKATDFLSRLRGYVDILGPNRFGPDDDSFVVRRAFLLRQMLERKAPQVVGPHGVRIDPGVANAFLSVERYVHGARSMESIIDMSALTDRSRFGRSSLPAPHQLSLHVDTAEFLRLIEQA